MTLRVVLFLSQTTVIHNYCGESEQDSRTDGGKRDAVLHLTAPARPQTARCLMSDIRLNYSEPHYCHTCCCYCFVFVVLWLFCGCCYCCSPQFIVALIRSEKENRDLRFLILVFTALLRA